jgi:hypothetical protein
MSGGETASVEWSGGRPSVELRVPFRADRVERYLIQFRHADGEIMGAEGAGLPPESDLLL